jgi:stage II sporulation protein GA (sporulation sigma-E factor processing peptidase)
MEVDVYVDLLFLINTAMDGLCLSVTAKLLHRRVTPWRVILAALLGGGYAVAALLMEGGQILSLVLDLAVCVLLCGVAFGASPRSGRGILRVTLLYLLLSLVLGGIMTALFSLFNRLGLDEALSGFFKENGGGDGVEAWVFGLVALLGSGLTLWGGRFLRGGKVAAACRVTVSLDGRQAELEGMTDTGNLLRDPMGGRVVICADPRRLTAILPPDLARYLAEGGDPAHLTPSSARRIKVIPARTAAGERLLYGFLPDAVTLDKGDGAIGVEAVIAVTKLTGIEAIVPAELCK